MGLDKSNRKAVDRESDGWRRINPADINQDSKEDVKMSNDRHVWETALKEFFEDFMRKVEMAEVPEVFTLTFLKDEVKKLEDRVDSWIDLSNYL